MRILCAFGADATKDACVLMYAAQIPFLLCPAGSFVDVLVWR